MSEFGLDDSLDRSPSAAEGASVVKAAGRGTGKEAMSELRLWRQLEWDRPPGNGRAKDSCFCSCERN